MAETVKVCVDKALPPTGHNERLAFVKDKRWKGKNIVLRVAYLEPPTDALRSRIELEAAKWCAHAKIALKFGNQPKDAQIRIAFIRDAGSWSYLGKDNRDIPKDQPTMNLGWLDDATGDDEVRRVVIHEFGHALGCIHEHQNPAQQIQWNKPVVYSWYKATQGWDAAKVDRNLFEKYAATLTVHSQFDPDSIMLYPIPKHFTLDGFETGWNDDLSQLDCSLIACIYP